MGRICILLLAVLATTTVDSWSYRGSSRGSSGGYYGGSQSYKRGPRYGYNGVSNYHRGYKGYNKSPYNKGLSVLPKCTSGYTKLEIGVVGPDGKCLPGVCVHVTDSSSSTEHTTNRNGLIAVTVKGCRAQLSVSNQEYEADVQEVNLESCEDGKEKVVLSLTKKCNFYLYFVGDDEDFDELLHYSYTSSSGATGFGTTIGGCGTAPTCIYVDVSEPSNENLRIRLSKASGGNTINELEYTGLDSDAVFVAMPTVINWGARMGIPSIFNEIPHADVLFYVYVNAWYISGWNGCDDEILPEVVNLYSIDDDDTDTIVVTDSTASMDDFSLSDYGFALDKNSAAIDGKDILICIDLETTGGLDGVRIKGGAVFVDSNGKTTTNTIIGSVDTTDDATESYAPFCVCGGDPKKVVKVDPTAAFVVDCALTIVDACEMAKLCNCPNSKEEDYCTP